MDPKLLRMYSDILGEQTSQSYSGDISSGDITYKVGTGGSGFGTQNPGAATGEPAIAPVRQGAKPTGGTAPRQGVVGADLAKTSGGQFASRADRTNQAKVDAALGPGFKAGSREANLALQQKFRQAPTAAAPTQATTAPKATDAASLAAAQGKSPATEPAADQTTPNQMRTTSAVGASNIGFTGPETPTSQAAFASSGGSSMTNPANAAQGQTGAGSSGYTNPAGMSGIDSTLDSKSNSNLGAKVAGTTNVYQEPEEKIAARGPGVMGYIGGNEPTKKYDSLSDFGSAVGDKIKDMFGGNKPAPDTSAGSGPNLGVGTLGSTPNRSMQENELEEEVEESVEKELAEAFNDMLRLSGIQLNEKAVSKQQQKFMGMVHAMQKGEKVKGASPELKKVAKGMGKKDARDFAATKHKGLPKKVTEGLNLMLDEEGHTLEHIVNRFKHEAKTFLNTGEMSDKLYDALYDYYLDRGEMPYGIAKAREGDPYTWVAARFEADIDGTVDVKMPVGEVGGDDTLNELARLAGLSEGRAEQGMAEGSVTPDVSVKKIYDDGNTKEWHIYRGKEMIGYVVKNLPDTAEGLYIASGYGPGRGFTEEFNGLKSAVKYITSLDNQGVAEGQVNECGDMGMDTEDRLNVSTNMSSDGTKSVNISAQGEKAEELLSMLKLAGMGDNMPRVSDGADMDHPGAIEIHGTMDADGAEQLARSLRSKLGNDEMMEADLEEAKKRRSRYSNTPDEEYQTVASITRQGNDLNREKKQFAGRPRLGDNPMAESMLDEELSALLDSVLVKEADRTVPRFEPPENIEDREKPYKDEKTGKTITPPKGLSISEPVSPAKPVPGIKR